ncbi:MAG: hypothetical protein PHD32_11890, partial [Eubacteriales bacterium]|nr:hypothetical protein [Eubacteriales bacterium]
TLLCAAAYAAGTICSQLFFIKAVECGSVALSSLLYAYGFLLPTVYGTLAYHETLRLAQVAGCVLIAGALLLCLGGKKGKFSLRWLVFALLATVSSGGVGIVQKVFRCSPYRDALDSFLILAFALVALASLLLWLTVPRKKSPAAPAGSRRKFFLAALALAGVVCAANKLNLYLSGVFPSVVMFPCVNGGCILLSLLVSRVFFHEVITRRQLAGIFTGVAAIVLISLP